MENSRYRGGQFNGGRMVMLWRSSIKKREWLLQSRPVLYNGGGMVLRGGQSNGGRMVLLRRWPV